MIKLVGHDVPRNLLVLSNGKTKPAYYDNLEAPHVKHSQ
jgi:hypothetical protein